MLRPPRPRPARRRLRRASPPPPAPPPTAPPPAPPPPYPAPARCRLRPPAAALPGAVEPACLAAARRHHRLLAAARGTPPASPPPARPSAPRPRRPARRWSQSRAPRRSPTGGSSPNHGGHGDPGVNRRTAKSSRNSDAQNRVGASAGEPPGVARRRDRDHRFPGNWLRSERDPSRWDEHDCFRRNVLDNVAHPARIHCGRHRTASCRDRGHDPDDGATPGGSPRRSTHSILCITVTTALSPSAGSLGSPCPTMIPGSSRRSGLRRGARLCDHRAAPAARARVHSARRAAAEAGGVRGRRRGRRWLRGRRRGGGLHGAGRAARAAEPAAGWGGVRAAVGRRGAQLAGARAGGGALGGAGGGRPGGAVGGSHSTKFRAPRGAAGGSALPQPWTIAAGGGGNAPRACSALCPGAAEDRAAVRHRHRAAVSIGRPILALPTTYVPAARSPTSTWKRVESIVISPIQEDATVDDEPTANALSFRRSPPNCPVRRRLGVRMPSLPRRAGNACRTTRFSTPMSAAASTAVRKCRASRATDDSGLNTHDAGIVWHYARADRDASVGRAAKRVVLHQ